MASAPERSLVAKAVDAIKSTNLSALDHMMFMGFLINAVSCDEAAQFIIDQVPQDSPDEALRSVKTGLACLADECMRKFPRRHAAPFFNNVSSFWDDPPVNDRIDAALRERDANRCCVTGQKDVGLKPTYIVSPSIKDDQDLHPGGPLRGLLEAFISKELTDQLFLYLESSGPEGVLKTLWLMSPSVRHDFKNAHIFMERGESVTNPWWISKQFLDESEVSDLHSRFHKMPTTPDQHRLPLPEQFLLRIHQIISIPLHFAPIEEKISRGWPQDQKTERGLGRFGRLLLRGFFLVVPTSLHPCVYRQILKAIDRWRPQPTKMFSTPFKSLPFGLCLKIGPRVSENEANALLLAEKYTTINAPLLINFTRDKETGYLLMTKISGVSMETVFWRMTYEERCQLAKDLGKCINQLRRIPNKNEHAICDTIGGPLIDHRLEPEGSWGPYNSKTQFLDDLTASLESYRGQPPLSYLYHNDHEICFTHSDLSLSNLFLERGRLSGIIDWEHAGFKPEYWEYTRAVWSDMSDRKLASDYSLAYDKSYHEELEAERMLWRLKPVY